MADPCRFEAVLLYPTELPSGPERVWIVSGSVLTAPEFAGISGPKSPELELVVANEYDSLVICLTVLVVTWHCSAGPWARSGAAKDAQKRIANGLILDLQDWRRHDRKDEAPRARSVRPSCIPCSAGLKAYASVVPESRKLPNTSSKKPKPHIPFGPLGRRVGRGTWRHRHAASSMIKCVEISRAFARVSDISEGGMLTVPSGPHVTPAAASHRHSSLESSKGEHQDFQLPCMLWYE